MWLIILEGKVVIEHGLGERNIQRDYLSFLIFLEVVIDLNTEDKPVC